MSKFDKIFEAREASDEELVPLETQSKSTNKKNTGKTEKSKLVAVPSKITVSNESLTPQKQRGRPKAKRSDPNYVGFTTYIRKATHLKVKIALLQEGNGQELSELVEALLTDWVKTK